MTIECYASAADGTFTIPSAALYSLPQFMFGRFLINVVTGGTFTATGLTLEVINSSGPQDVIYPIAVIF